MKYSFLFFLLSSQAAICPLSAQQADWVSLATSEVELNDVTAQRIYVSDVNNDHYPDVVVISGPAYIGTQDNLQVYLNIPAASSSGSNGRMFANVTETSGINASPSASEGNSLSLGTTVAALADVNNDGNVDVVRGNYYGSSLSSYTDHGDRCEVLLGDGTGRFTLVPDNGLRELGLINPVGFSFLDYDKDGKLDLFIARWFHDYGQNQWSAGILMKGNGDGTFTNMSVSAGITQQEPMFGSCVVDWNNDGWPDIATAPYCRTNGQLWKNNGNGTFTNVATQTGYNARYMNGDNGQTLCMWGSMPEDFDNDGDMDFFFSLVHGGNDAGEGHSTIVTNGGGSADYRLDWALDRISRKPPMSSHNGDYDGSWLDIDNDGLVDLAMTQGHYQPATDRLYVFHQQPDHTFPDATGALGLVIPEARNVHQLEAVDYDLDGDDDILFCKNDHPRTLHLVRNDIGHTKSWTAVRLTAPSGVNRDCIGARIVVYAGSLVRTREVYAGRGNGAGQQPLALVFGLDDRTTIDSVRVHWPDAAATVTTVRNPPVNRYLEITGNGLTVPQTEQIQPEIRLKVYPNPADKFILVQLEGKKDDKPSSVMVYDLTGRQIAGQEYVSGDEVAYFSIDNIPAGCYLVRVTTQRGATLSKSFIKGYSIK